MQFTDELGPGSLKPLNNTAAITRYGISVFGTVWQKLVAYLVENPGRKEEIY